MTVHAMHADEDDLNDTEYERVKSTHEQHVTDAMLDEASAIAEAFPEWTVWVSAGPHRKYGVEYGVEQDDGYLWVDYDAVHPTIGDVDEIISDMAAYLDLQG